MKKVIKKLEGGFEKERAEQQERRDLEKARQASLNESREQAELQRAIEASEREAEQPEVLRAKAEYEARVAYTSEHNEKQEQRDLDKAMQASRFAEVRKASMENPGGSYHIMDEYGAFAEEERVKKIEQDRANGTLDPRMEEQLRLFEAAAALRAKNVQNDEAKHIEHEALQIDPRVVRLKNAVGSVIEKWTSRPDADAVDADGSDVDTIFSILGNSDYKALVDALTKCYTYQYSGCIQDHELAELSSGKNYP